MKIKIASFNLANLVLPDTAYYGHNIYAKEEYSNKTAWIAHQLRSMNADIVAFQEVFHKDALVHTINESGIYKDFHLAIDESHKGRSPANAILSRFPIQSSRIIKEFPENSLLKLEDGAVAFHHFRHPVLNARIRLPNGKSVEVFSVHLKSKRPLMEEGHRDDDYNTFSYGKGKARALFIRTAEAVALRSILSSVMQSNDLPVIVMGDLNDSVHSVTSSIITGDEPQRRFSTDAKRQIRDEILYSTYFMQARQSDRNVYFTHIHNGHYESLDHILLSQEFYPANNERIGQVEYMKTYNDHLIDSTLTDEELPSWLSDHAQVLVSLELKT